MAAIRLKSFVVAIRKEKSDSIITNDNDLEAAHVVSAVLIDSHTNVCHLVELQFGCMRDLILLTHLVCSTPTAFYLSLIKMQRYS